MDELTGTTTIDPGHAPASTCGVPRSASGADPGVVGRRRTDAAAHPLLAFLTVLDRELTAVAPVDPIFMSTTDKRDALLDLRRQRVRLEALELRLTASAGDVATDDGDPNVAAWLGPRTLDDPVANHRIEKLGRRVTDRWTLLGQALATGSVNTNQARVIVESLDRLEAADLDLPAEAKHGLLDQAQVALIEYAAAFPPARLRVLGRRILAILAPDLFDDEERKRLEEEERRAHAQTRLSITNRGDGTADVRARLSHVAAQRLKTILEAFTSPRKADGETGGIPLTDPATGGKVPHDQRLGIAFQAFLESLDPTRLPVKAGAGTSLVITLDYDQLQQRLGAGTLPDGERISPSESRRLACNAGLIPAVLGGMSQVLDLGVDSRLFSRNQRIAHRIGHPTCQAHGCTVPADWCEGHHRTPWAQGGTTNQDDLVFLCPWHHHRAHDPDYVVKYLPNGDLRFHRRT